MRPKKTKEMFEQKLMALREARSKLLRIPAAKRTLRQRDKIASLWMHAYRTEKRIKFGKWS